MSDFELIPIDEFIETPKHAGGRPLKFETPETLQTLIDEYFVSCENTGKPYTVSGLSYWLDIDRKTLLNYSERDEFFHTIKRAKLRIETNQEERLIDKNTFTPGIIFNLKNNFDWIDETKVEETSIIQVDVNAMLLKVYGSPTPVIESESTS